MIPFLIALTFPILLILVFAISSIFLIDRWNSIIGGDSGYPRIGDMKVHTFFSISRNESQFAVFLVIPIVGVVFGGIHCAGWFFEFPSNDEAILWRVCSTILTSFPVLFPLYFFFLARLYGFLDSINRPVAVNPLSVLFILIYAMSRLLLLVEAVISLRRLTPGTLALVNWTSFIPHI